jgi:hypothetical protein
VLGPRKLWQPCCRHDFEKCRNRKQKIAFSKEFQHRLNWSLMRFGADQQKVLPSSPQSAPHWKIMATQELVLLTSLFLSYICMKVSTYLHLGKNAFSVVDKCMRMFVTLYWYSMFVTLYWYSMFVTLYWYSMFVTLYWYSLRNRRLFCQVKGKKVHVFKRANQRELKFTIVLNVVK